jgi:hypothetical protein
LFRAGVPPTRIEYLTLACEGDSTVTALTLDVAEEASEEEAWDWMIEANVEPFWSRLTRLDTGVLGLKKASQLALT